MTLYLSTCSCDVIQVATMAVNRGYSPSLLYTGSFWNQTTSEAIQKQGKTAVLLDSSHYNYVCSEGLEGTGREPAEKGY